MIVNQPVVIDNVRISVVHLLLTTRIRWLCRLPSCFVTLTLQGSGVIKAGFAGDQIPKCRFPN